MNDISYCRDTCWDLIEASQVLFSTSSRIEQSVEQIIMLDEHEIAEINEAPDEELSHEG